VLYLYTHFDTRAYHCTVRGLRRLQNKWRPLYLTD